MAFTIPIEVNGKTYDYPVMLFDADYTYNETFDYYAVKNLKKGTQYTESYPLITFLELDTNLNNMPYNVNIKINGIEYSCTMKRYFDSNTFAVLEWNNKTLAYSAPETVNDGYTGTINVVTYAGTGLGYNYRDKKFHSTNGSKYLFPSSNRSYYNVGTKLFYDGKYYSKGVFVSYDNDIIAEEYTQSPLSNDADLSDVHWYAAYFAHSNEGLGGIINGQINPPNPPNYPDDPDDPEDDDPTDPTPGPQDPISDPIPIPQKPTIDVTGTGFVTLYNPSAIDIRDLAYFMWSGEFVDLIKKMFSAPFDALIGLKLMYAPVTAGASQTIWLGNVESDVSAPKITDQFTDFDCGSIAVSEYFGSFLDYAPYTKVSIFLPFIGYKQLNVDEVMNSTIHLVYRIDAYSGACIAFLQITKTIGSTNLNSVLYQFDGNAAMDIPFTSNDMSRYVSAILNTAASTALALSTGGASAGLASTSATTGAVGNLNETKGVAPTQPNMKAIGALANGAMDVLTTKPNISRGGSLAGANASMGVKRPYIIIERPMQQMPGNYANFIGIPLNMTKKLSQVTGFTIVSQIFMTSTTATEEEINMIEQLLQTGVIL